MPRGGRKKTAAQASGKQQKPRKKPKNAKGSSGAQPRVEIKVFPALRRLSSSQHSSISAGSERSMKSEPMKWPPNADEKKENFVVIEWGGQLQEPVEGQEGGSRAQSGADAGPSQSSDKDLEEQKRDPSDPVAFFESAALDFYEDDEPTNCLEIREGSFVELRDELIKGGVKLEPPKKRPFVAEVLKLFQTGDGRRMMEVRFFHRLENTAITEKHGSGKKKDDDDGDEEDEEEEEEDSQRDKIDAAREKEFPWYHFKVHGVKPGDKLDGRLYSEQIWLNQSEGTLRYCDLHRVWRVVTVKFVQVECEKGAGKRLWSMPEERDRATREGYDYWYWATHRKVFMEFSRVEHDDVARLVPGGPWPEHWAKESGMRAALERRKEREAGEGSGVAMGKATEEESGMAMGAGGEGESQVTGEPREKRVLRMLDLFSGCGGLSFMDGDSDGCVIKTLWAVDVNKAALNSFQLNYQDAQTFQDGTEHFLALCQLVEDRYTAILAKGEEYVARMRGEIEDSDSESGMDSDSNADGSSCRVREIKDIKVQIKPCYRHGEPDSIFVYEGSLDGDGDEGEEDGLGDEEGEKGAGGTAAVRKGKPEIWEIARPTEKKHFELMYLVAWAGEDANGYPHADTWLPESVVNAPQLVDKCVVRMVEELRIPTRGTVDVIAGGPPCQGISGLNKNRKTCDEIENFFRVVDEDPRNRQGPVFWSIVEWFKPSYALMENVVDIVKYKGGTYLNYCLVKVLGIGYQCRVGCLTAAQFGAPQGRARIFLVAARPEEALPPMPLPTHRPWFDTTINLPQAVKQCFMKYENLSPDIYSQLWDPVLVGDALTDLPPVDNWSISEHLPYARPPQTPYQRYMRRPPPRDAASLESRLSQADPHLRSQLDAIRNAVNSISTEALGLTQTTRGANSKWEEYGAERIAAARLDQSKALELQEEKDQELQQPKKRQRVSKAKGKGKGKAKAGGGAGSRGGDGDGVGQSGGGGDGVGGEGVGDGVGNGAGDGEMGEEEEDQDAAAKFANEVYATHIHHVCSQVPNASGVVEAGKGGYIDNCVGLSCTHEALLLGQQLRESVAREEEAAERRERDRELRLLYTVQSHRPLTLNIEDYLRVCAVPKRAPYECGDDERANRLYYNFRDMPGVVNGEGKSVCVGHCHAPITFTKHRKTKVVTEHVPCRSRTRIVSLTWKRGMARPRVDIREKWTFRCTGARWCMAYTVYLPTAGLLVTRWLLTFLRGKSGASRGRQSPYGRLFWDCQMSTVVTRAEPHNLQLLHPTQNRVLTVREMARLQGFPDYFVLLWGSVEYGPSLVRSAVVQDRYNQIGNAVSPPVATALGICMRAAAVGVAPHGAGASPWMRAVDPERVRYENDRATKSFFRTHILEKGVTYMDPWSKATVMARLGDDYVPHIKIRDFARLWAGVYRARGDEGRARDMERLLGVFRGAEKQVVVKKDLEALWADKESWQNKPHLRQAVELLWAKSIVGAKQTQKGKGAAVAVVDGDGGVVEVGVEVEGEGEGEKEREREGERDEESWSGVSLEDDSDSGNEVEGEGEGEGEGEEEREGEREGDEESWSGVSLEDDCGSGTEVEGEREQESESESENGSDSDSDVDVWNMEASDMPTVSGVSGLATPTTDDVDSNERRSGGGGARAGVGGVRGRGVKRQRGEVGAERDVKGVKRQGSGVVAMRGVVMGTRPIEVLDSDEEEGVGMSAIEVPDSDEE